VGRFRRSISLSAILLDAEAQKATLKSQSRCLYESNLDTMDWHNLYCILDSISIYPSNGGVCRFQTTYFPILIRHLADD
jgi:hypothetical protein